MNIFRYLHIIYNELFEKIKGGHKLFLYAIFTISIDSFPWIPINTNNRPIFIFFLIFYWFFTKIVLKKVYKFEIIAFIVLICLWIYSIFCYFLFFNTIAPFNKFILTSILSYITICTTFFFIKSSCETLSIEELIDVVGKAYIISFVLPAIIGVIQILGIHFVSMQSYADSISNIFSSAQNNIFDANRIKLTSNEPSQAGTYILYILIYLRFLKLDKKIKNFIWIVSLIFLLYINSSVVFLTLLIVIILNWIFYGKKSAVSIIRNTLFGIFLFLLSFIIYNYFLSDYTARRFIQLGDLVSNISLENLILLSSVDFSILDRFGTPIFGLYSLKLTHLIGTGGDGFYKIYETVINTYFPELNNNQYLGEQFYNQTGTIKFLPIKIISEFGIIGVIGILYGLIKFINGVSNCKKNEFIAKIKFAFIFAIFSSYLPSYFNFNFILLVSIIYFTIFNSSMKYAKISIKANPKTIK